MQNIADLGFIPQEGALFGLGLRVRGHLRERCVSGRGVDLPKFSQRIATSESVRQMTSFSSVTITATESMSMKRASSGLTSVR